MNFLWKSANTRMVIFVKKIKRLKAAQSVEIPCTCFSDEWAVLMPEQIRAPTLRMMNSLSF